MTTFFSDKTREAVADVLFDGNDQLYRHSKRPEWGVAILLRDDGSSRTFQFEDGRRRKFKKGYFNLMNQVDEVRGSRKRVIRDLTRAAKSDTRNRGSDTLEAVAPFKAQVELFRSMYPGGFADDEWVSRHRHPESGDGLKRHRDPVVKAAREALAQDVCADLIANDEHEALVDVVLSLLSSTDLVAVRHVRLLKGLESDQTVEFAEAINNLLHGENDYSQRFRGYLRVMTQIIGERPSWRLATALPALVFPQEQVCVRHSAFRRQAGSIAPSGDYSRRARTRSYQSFRQVASAVRKRLQAEGLEPRDMLDVHDFIWATLRNAALEHLTGDAA
jgi:hypothetical protein